MGSIEQLLSYKQQSTITGSEDQRILNLCASQPINDNTVFFNGQLKSPVETARCLRAISILVGSRFFTPPAMLARILRESDPVVTVSRKMIRFEGFSACCSTYGRLDILPDGFEASKIAPGTTNIDFNTDMRGVLAKVRSGNAMSMSVRSDEFELTHADTKIIEKKVKLPLRWIKGFSEVQSSQNAMTVVFEISRNEAIRFFRMLPKGSTRHPAWIVTAGKGIRLSHREIEHSVRIKGVERLAVLADLVQLSTGLSIYVNAQNTISAWVISFGCLRFTMVLSEEVWRGFSGEGQLLKDLVSNTADKVVNTIKGALNWQESLSVEQLAFDLEQDESVIKVALNTLASRGVVGFDVFSGNYFHRVLPFDMSKVDDLNPRIKAARKLISEDAVLVNYTDDEVVKGEIESGGITHRVELSTLADKCTCPWFAKHRSSRGPCKHILSVQMITEEKT